jgi:hypothetical protein
VVKEDKKAPPKKRFKKFIKYRAIGFAVLVGGLIVLGVILDSQASNAAKAAQAAEQARLAADPVTVSGIYIAFNKERAGNKASITSLFPADSPPLE